MDIGRFLGDYLGFRGKKRKREDDIHRTSAATPPIPTVFQKPPRKVNESFYEVHSPSGLPTMEVLFFHGVQFGDCTNSHLWTTWESRDRSCIWPEKLLAEDFPEAKIMFVSYDGGLMKRNFNSSDLYIIVENLISDLLEDGIGQMRNRPLILVGHCFGGLVIKQLCLGIREMIPQVHGTDRVKLQNLLNNLKGIFYYDSPHHGFSGLNKVRHIQNDPLLTFFQTLSRDTERLNSRFNQLRGLYGWQIRGLGASLPTKSRQYHMLVTEASGREGDVFNVAEGVDHDTICQPKSKLSRSFYALVELLKKIVRENKDTLEGSGAHSLVPLPFAQDPNYVPIADAIMEIRNALEREGGPRVLTVYGVPGTGKSSMVKHIALLYAEERKSSSSTFPDGVHYLHCGLGAQDRVKELQLKLFKCLGFGVCASTASDLTAGEVQQGEYFHIPSHDKSLTSEQKSLIVLDDLWEKEVFQQLLVPTKGVKYLITSQNRGIGEICHDAEKFQMKNPTFSEARHIMANFTEGLPTKGKFPDSVQMVTDAVIHTLNYHPLSLADVGLSVNRRRATNESQWKLILDSIPVCLDENDSRSSPGMFDKTYDLTVGASMMLMVQSLHPAAQRFLFLMALLGGEEYLPEPLVRIFHKFLQKPDQTKAYVRKFFYEEKYLEDRSLIELHSTGDESKLMLGAHRLRMHFIREKKRREVRSIASDILASSDQGVDLIQSGDADGTLVTILSAVYFQNPFTDVVANALEKHLRIMNDAVIHRNINNDTNIRLMVSKVHEVSDLLWLLNVDDAGHGWKPQAHECAKKIIIKLACQGKLDDCSMACLLKLPQTTSVACTVLARVVWFRTLGACNAFSRTHVETMKTLLTLLDDTAASTTRRAAVCAPLQRILDNESKDTILDVAAKGIKILTMDSNPALQIAIIGTIFSYVTRQTFVMGTFTPILDVLLGLLLASKDSEVRVSAGKALISLCLRKSLALKTTAFLDTLAKVMKLFVSKETPYKIACVAGRLLVVLSYLPQNRIRLGPIEGFLQNLGDVLADLEGQWRATSERDWNTRDELEKRATIDAELLVQLALEFEPRGCIASLPGVREGLLFLQQMEMAGLRTKVYDNAWNSAAPTYGSIYSTRALTAPTYGSIYSTRALTILCPNHSEQIQEVLASDGLLCSKHLERIQEVLATCGLLCPNHSERIREVLATVGLLCPNHSERIREVLATDGLLCPNHSERIQEVLATNGRPPSGTSHVADMYVPVYWARVRAHIDVEDFTAALHNLELACYYLDLLPPNCRRHVGVRDVWEGEGMGGVWLGCSLLTSFDASWIFSSTRVFLLTMLKDQAGALLALDTMHVPEWDLPYTTLISKGKALDTMRMTECSSFTILLSKGIVKRIFGDLQGALHYLNRARCCLIWESLSNRAGKIFLKHRGYVKYLMKDEAGAREDAEAAHKGTTPLECGELTIDFGRAFTLHMQPLNYLGYNFPGDVQLW